MTLVLPVIANPCEACVALYGSSCCKRIEGSTFQFPISYAESARLARRLGGKVLDVVDRRRVSEEHQKQLQLFGSELAGLVVNGRALYLPTDETGTCRYLHGPTCTVSDIKPHICAMFPFKKVGGAWALGVFVSVFGSCYGQDASGLDVDAALTLFGTSRKRLDAVYDQWKRDLKGHAANMAKLRSGK